MNVKGQNITIIGGDLRQVYMANILSEDNNVTVYGLNHEKLSDKVIQSKDLKQTLKNTNIIMLPIPTTKDNNTIKAPYSEEKIAISEVITNINNKTIVIGLKLCEYMTIYFNLNNIRYYDLNYNEDFLILNAVPTAEGVMMDAIENSDIILSGSNCLVIGYGRCGKIVADKLKGIGCNVSLTTRSQEKLSLAKSYGFKIYNLSELRDIIKKYNFIINTVPVKILVKNILDNVDKNSLIIDIASGHGGVDFEYAEQLGIKAIHRLGIPGKVAPKTAAEIIVESVRNLQI